MRFYVCIDDTDTLDSIGTGTICEMIRDRLEDENIAKCSLVTRHQLLIHEDIPYTSHNSSMCFEGTIADACIEDVYRIAVEVVESNSAMEADPGICVAADICKTDREKLIQFGDKALKQVLTKDMAYELAKETDVILSEHGGTGQGVIGAIAGVGLRMSGDNGELKGVLKKIRYSDFSVEEVTGQFSVDSVETVDGCLLGPDEIVRIERQTKVLLKNNRYTLLVKEEGGKYVAMDKTDIRKTQLADNLLGEEDADRYRVCKHFKPDVEEERVVHREFQCYNCMFRRWETFGITCQKKERSHV